LDFEYGGLSLKDFYAEDIEECRKIYNNESYVIIVSIFYEMLLSAGDCISKVEHDNYYRSKRIHAVLTKDIQLDIGNISGGGKGC
jgi:hypothetical protein